VAKFGGVDICVTTLAGLRRKGFLAASNEEWQKAVEAEPSVTRCYFRQGSHSTYAEEKVGADCDHLLRSRRNSRWRILCFRMPCVLR